MGKSSDSDKTSGGQVWICVHFEHAAQLLPLSKMQATLLLPEESLASIKRK